MGFKNLRKETSERSDEANWAKHLMQENGAFACESIEGCNQNSDNVVTHLLERARVDIEVGPTPSMDDVYRQIVLLEGESPLRRKLNFASCFGLPLSYVFYCDETQQVVLVNLDASTRATLFNVFNSYKEFSDWIASVKGWRSRKVFREAQDLPYFDKELRAAGTAWPTNIDCFISDERDRPFAIVEFQNANATKVTKHCSNDFFLCKTSGTNEYGYTVYFDDIRRWTSQEILRVQSGLRYFVVTWSQAEEDFTLKEVDRVTIPFFPTRDGKPDWDYMNAYKRALNKYTVGGRNPADRAAIEKSYRTFNLEFRLPNMITVIHEPMLSEADKTFPSLYYKTKLTVVGNRGAFIEKFAHLVKES